LANGFGLVASGFVVGNELEVGHNVGI
jgi:hypothetical protein